jgi:glycosyltransferase involved in cell wall biosynthesis
MKTFTQKEIILNGKFLSRPLTGVDRFADETIRALDKILGKNDLNSANLKFSLAVPENVKKKSPYENIPIVYKGKTNGIVWEQLELPLICFGRNLVNFCNVGPIFKYKQMVVVHDAAPAKFPETFSKLFRIWYRILMPIMGKLSKQIYTVSEFSKKEINEAYGISYNKIRLISESGEHITRFDDDRSILEKHGLNHRPYVLAVSSLAAHKNFRIIFDAFKLLETPNFDLVVAGGTNPQVFAGIGEPLPEFVKHVGYVTDAQLKTLMSNAMCFVFPSIYEGFGIPPLEAMSCGCPVLAANAASIPEVCGEAALYFNPRNSKELSGLICSMANNPKLHKEYVIKGKIRSSEFSWENSALEVLKSASELA